jgi:hypothetical protein
MAMTNQQRQAAFKEKMRLAGKQQATVWTEPSQLDAIKTYLAGDHHLRAQPAQDRAQLEERERQLAEQEARLFSREERVDTLSLTNTWLVNEIAELKAQLAAATRKARARQGFRVDEPADRAAMIAEAMRAGGYSGDERTVDDLKTQTELAKKFSAEIKGTKSRLHGFIEVVSGTKAVTAKQSWSAYSFGKSILTESERDLLSETCALLGRIGNDVDRAGRDIKMLHAQRDAERKVALAKTEALLTSRLFNGLDRRGARWCGTSPTTSLLPRTVVSKIWSPASWKGIVGPTPKPSMASWPTA